MSEIQKIEDTVEAWETGQLGNDEQFVRKVSPEDQKQIDDSLGLQAISIRLDKDLIDTFKQLAKIHGMGYQPLMREVLKRFAESEIKVLIAQMAATERKEKLDNGNRKLEVEVSLDFDQKHAA